MRMLLIFLVLLLASLAPPVGHSAHRRAHGCRQPGAHLHLQPIRVLRTPQGPKSVRVVPVAVG